MQVGLSQALAFRLARQHLTQPAADPLVAARALIGAQAQAQSAAILQLRARTAGGFGIEAAEAALWRDRNLIKLWGHRGTLHLVARDDVALLLALRRHRIGYYMNWYTGEGLTPDQVDRMVAAIVEALTRHGPHSRMDLSRRLVPDLGEWARPLLEHSWGGVIKLACALGHACHGPAAGGPDGRGEREAKFVHLPTWIGEIDLPEERAALAGLVRRYLRAFGPATPADIRKFAGLYAGPVTEALGALGDEVATVTFQGRPALILAQDAEALRHAEPAAGGITVTPLFDPYLLGHVDTSQYLDDRFRPAVYRTAGWISPVVLRQGRVVATWTHKRTAKGWDVTVTPLETVWKKELPAITRALRRLAGEETLAGVRLAA